MKSSAPLVPEFLVSDLDVSLAFYCGLLGFTVRYDRPENRFAYLEREGAELMLEEPVGRTFLAARLKAPFGRGVNLQIQVSDLNAILAPLDTANVLLFSPEEQVSYRREQDTVLQRQCVVQDPDGYLLRFAQLVAQE